MTDTKTAETKAITHMGAQGDVMFRRVDAIPAGATRMPGATRVVVAHSETGHHHYLEGPGIDYYRHNDPLVCYLQLAEETDVIHARPWDTHATLRLPAGVFEVRRQREWTIAGHRRVED